MPVVVLYSTTTPALAKVKADIARIKRILDNKRVAYEEVRCGPNPVVDSRRRFDASPAVSSPRTPPRQRTADGEQHAQPSQSLQTPRSTFCQVDLASAPGRRAEMLKGSDDVKIIPQLHVNGRVRAACMRLGCASARMHACGCVSMHAACMRRIVGLACAAHAWQVAARI